MAQPGVTSPIIGPRTMAQLEDNLPAADIELTEEDARAIDALIPPGRMAAPFYEADFGPTASVCIDPCGRQIPTLVVATSPKSRNHRRQRAVSRAKLQRDP